jgi:hypothetical protein
MRTSRRQLSTASLARVRLTTGVDDMRCSLFRTPTVEEKSSTATARRAKLYLVVVIWRAEGGWSWGLGWCAQTGGPGSLLGARELRAHCSAPGNSSLEPRCVQPMEVVPNLARKYFLKFSVYLCTEKTIKCTWCEFFGLRVSGVSRSAARVAARAAYEGMYNAHILARHVR